MGCRELQPSTLKIADDGPRVIYITRDFAIAQADGLYTNVTHCPQLEV